MSNFPSDLFENDSNSYLYLPEECMPPQNRLDAKGKENFLFEITPSFNESFCFKSTDHSDYTDNCKHDVFGQDVSMADYQEQNEPEPTKNQDVPDKICENIENNSGLNLDAKKNIFQAKIIKLEPLPTSKESIDKNRRKLRDGITKKVLTHAFKYFNNVFNVHLKKHREKFENQNFPKEIKNLANKNFKAQVSIDFVKNRLDEKMIDIYSEKWGDLNGTEDSHYINNCKIISFFKNSPEILNDFKIFLTRTFDEEFQNYLDSKYASDKIKIKEKQLKGNLNLIEVNDYMKKFEMHVIGCSESGVLGFREYYRITPGNKKIKRKEN